MHLDIDIKSNFALRSEDATADNFFLPPWPGRMAHALLIWLADEK